jgi:hypothetical protein
MAHAVEKNDVWGLTNEEWLRDARSNFDVAATLTSVLTPIWTVERELDPSGDLSIVVLPVGDSDFRPTFLLHEEDGLVQVSTFFGEDWHCRQAFATCQRAVAAIIAVAIPASPSVAHAPSTSRSTRARSSVR